MAIWSTIGAALRRGEFCALVSVVEARGSAPRGAGARMAVLQDGEFTGTIGGGALEWRALATARTAIAKAQAAIAKTAAGNGASPVRLKTQALGPDLGQCCGGSVRLMWEIFDAARLPEVDALADAERAGAFGTQSRITDRRVIRTIIDDEFAVDPSALHERFGQEKQPLALFGAGHVGRALIGALAPLDFATVWIDPRDGAFPAVTPGDVRIAPSPDPVAELDRLPDNAFVLVMSHCHALDFDVVAGALRARRFGYVGVIGSATKRARFQSRLRQAGMPGADIRRMVCPIGIAGIEGKQPSAIAASVAADLLCRAAQLKDTRQPWQPIAREALGR